MRTRQWILPILFAAAILAAVGIPGPGARASGYIYMADIFYPGWSDGFVRRMNVDTHAVETLASPGGGLRGLALDPVHRALYWTDVDRHTIVRAGIEGQAPANIVTNLPWPMDIDAFPAADRIAWGDQVAAIVGTAHLDGSGAAPLFSTPFASGIAFDPVNGRIYWTTAITADIGEIRRCNLDGTNDQLVITWGRPSAIAVDVAGGKVYWTDYVNDVVRRCNLDGTVRQTLYTVGSNLNPDGITLDTAAGKVYWAQAYANDRDKIMRMNLDGTNPEDVLIGAFGLISSLDFLGETADAGGTVFRVGSPLAAWPNPFTDASTIRLDLPAAQTAHLEVVAADGRLIATLADGPLPAGVTELLWDGHDAQGRPVPAGAYFYRLENAGETSSRKVILAR